MRKIPFLFAAALLAAGAASAQEGAVARAGGVSSVDEYPLTLGERPLVLPNLMLEGTTQFEHFRSTLGGTTSSQSGIGLRAGFGIGGIVQVDAISGVVLDPSSDWSKTLTGEVRVLALHTSQLDVAGLVSMPFDFHDNVDLVTVFTVGAPTRFKFTPMIYAFGLRDLLVFGTKGPTGNSQLQLGLNGTLGVGVDLFRQLSLELETTVFHAKITGDAEASRLIFSDTIPAALKALFAINHRFDVMAGLGIPDLKNAGDALTFVGGLNARL